MSHCKFLIRNKKYGTKIHDVLEIKDLTFGPILKSTLRDHFIQKMVKITANLQFVFSYVNLVFLMLI